MDGTLEGAADCVPTSRSQGSNPSVVALARACGSRSAGGVPASCAGDWAPFCRSVSGGIASCAAGALVSRSHGSSLSPAVSARAKSAADALSTCGKPYRRPMMTSVRKFLYSEETRQEI